MRPTQVQSLRWEDPLEKEMATHSSILALIIPGSDESGRLQSMGSQRVGHDWAISLSFFLIHNIKFYLFKCIVLWLAYLTMSSRVIHVWHLSDFLSFIKLNNIPFFVYTTFCLSIYPSTNTLVASAFCQLWTECYRNECTSIWIRVFNFGVHS